MLDQQYFPSKSVGIESFGGVGDAEKGTNLTGSAHKLTVSKFVRDIAGSTQDQVRRSIGIDCGGIQGRTIATDYERYFQDMAALIITHPHFDHVGGVLHVLRYTRETWKTFPIFATSLTIRAAEKILLDSVEIEQKKYDSQLRRAQKDWSIIADAYKALRQKKAISKDRRGNRLSQTTPHEQVTTATVHRKILDRYHMDIDDQNPRKTWFDRVQKPEYTSADVKALLQQMTPLEIEDGRTMLDLPDGEMVGIQFFNSGHIPGSIGSLIDIQKSDGTLFRAFFSGDIWSHKWQLHVSGISTAPTQQDLEASRSSAEADKRLTLDSLMVETTYGNSARPRENESHQSFVKQVSADLKTHNTLVLSAFSMDRSQNFIERLVRMKLDGHIWVDTQLYFDTKLGRELIPVFLDQAKKTLKEFEAEIGKPLPGDISRTDAIMRLKNYIEFLDPSSQYYTIIDSESRDEYLSLPGKKIIVTSGGMMEGGPILTYLEKFHTDPSVVFYGLGYAAEGTNAGNLEVWNKNQWRLSGVNNLALPYIKVDEKQYPLSDFRALYRRITGFSGHADRDDLYAYIDAAAIDKDTHIIGVHGDVHTTTSDFIASLISRSVTQNGHVMKRNTPLSWDL